MNMNRRSFLLAGAATCSLSVAPALHAQLGSRAVRPEDFGARGDGRTDDTVALQRCLEAAGPGGVVELRPRAVYLVDTNWQPSWNDFGGLKLLDGQTLRLNGAELRALPSSQPRGAVVQGFRTRDWRILGPGRITGERNRHRGEGGEWGMGIAAWKSTGWSIEGVAVTNCWGDGIYVGTPGESGYCQDFLIRDVAIANCRRNGISVVAGRDGRILGVDIRDVNGTAPRGGIDLEPDSHDAPNRNILIADGRIGGDLAVGIYVVVANENIRIERMDIEADNSGIIVSNNLNGVRIANSVVRSRVGGQEGAAIRTVGQPSGIRSLHIIGNRLSGGGYFVVDIPERGYRDIVVSTNEIRASNRGVVGIARIHAGTFTNNACVMGAGAGPSGEFFLHLVDVRYGGNSFRNETSEPLRGLYIRSTALGREDYRGPNITQVISND